jgi:hypothetical protein
MTAQTRACRCHDPVVWGHHSDCRWGTRFLEHLATDADPVYRAERERFANQEQAHWNRPLAVEGSRA